MGAGLSGSGHSPASAYRLVKNRESARNSRSRRKAYVEELEQKISVLTAEKAAMHVQLVSVCQSHAHPTLR